MVTLGMFGEMSGASWWRDCVLRENGTTVAQGGSRFLRVTIRGLGWNITDI